MVIHEFCDVSLFHIIYANLITIVISLKTNLKNEIL